MQLPLVVVIVNNQWAISVPRKAQTGAKTLAQKGIAAGIESIQVDGNDLIAMRAALDHAIKRARHGHGGTLIEAVTYRLSDHTTADDARRYRSEAEVKDAWQREPLKRIKTYLMGMNAWTEKEEEAWKADCATRVDAEVNAYLETKSQGVEAMFDFTYAEVPADLAAQREIGDGRRGRPLTLAVPRERGTRRRRSQRLLQGTDRNNAWRKSPSSKPSPRPSPTR